MAPASQNIQADDRLIAFQKAIDQRLGVGFDKEKRAALIKLQISSFKPQDDVREAFMRNDISSEEYFIAFNKVQNATLRAFNKVLGCHDFVRLFDTPFEDLPPVLEAALLTQAYGLMSPPGIPEE